MVNSRTDYAAEAVEAARSVMLELIRLLGEYRDDMTLCQAEGKTAWWSE